VGSLREYLSLWSCSWGCWGCGLCLLLILLYDRLLEREIVHLLAWDHLLVDKPVVNGVRELCSVAHPVLYAVGLDFFDIVHSIVRAENLEVFSALSRILRIRKHYAEGWDIYASNALKSNH
jgi:hypothetical protein